MNEAGTRKRALTTKSAAERAECAGQLLEAKTKDYVAADNSKENVCCFDCIKYGFPTDYSGHGQIEHLRDKLGKHFLTRHKNVVKNVWWFSGNGSAAKQMKLSDLLTPEPELS